MTLTPEESEVLDLLVDAWNAFVRLPVQHPMHNQEFALSLHQLQRLIMSRSTARELGLPEVKMAKEEPPAPRQNASQTVYRGMA